MRLILPVAALLAFAAPLPAAATDHSMKGAVAALNDPATQDRMANTVSAIIGALMQIQVGPLAEAVAKIDPQSDAAYIPSDATLGEIAGRDPHYAENMGNDIRASTRMAGQAASALAVYAPVLKDMARDLAAQWEQERAATRR